MLSPKKLAHLVLRVRDINESEKFYTEVLGLKVTSRDMGMVFMSANAEMSHELALSPVSEITEFKPGSAGLSHFAWQVESFEELRSFRHHLLESGIQILGTGDHGISIGIYLADPDGNRVEVFYELPKEKWPIAGRFLGKFPFVLED